MNASNAPNRYELFVLDEGEKPVEVTEDTKIPNAATIKVVKQDHTLANMIRGQLHAMPQVLFAGYKVPHPLQPYFLVKIQTDGTITPTAALEQACTKLIGTLSSLEAKFKREFSFKDVEGVTTEDAYGSSTAGPAWTSRRDYMDF
ncbi:DNA-directed RNA polymerase [Russula earlei]|uniref:DNA-directed RNA polymerase n=1 Tax=Russula earlei TaxID=71964 RepID=A0ACC0UDC6_9AGAM|nr:DNA-directed RNA polymerase [Russula earlei]